MSGEKRPYFCWCAYEQECKYVNMSKGICNLYNEPLKYIKESNALVCCKKCGEERTDKYFAGKGKY